MEESLEEILSRISDAVADKARTEAERTRKLAEICPGASSGANLMEIKRINDLASQYACQRQRKATPIMPDMTDNSVFAAHLKLLTEIANSILSHEHRTFVLDDNNKPVIQYLLLYFNDSPRAEDVFPGKNYKNHKNLLIYGSAGTGKSLLMQVFAKYLKATDNPNAFTNISVTEMVNYYSMHNNLDRFTYNEESGRKFDSIPHNLCLNDIGIGSKLFYGQDTKILTEEFLYARNEIWTMFRKKAHLTTNLTPSQLAEEYNDGYGRLADRFKTYNVIHLGGASRR